MWVYYIFYGFVAPYSTKLSGFFTIFPSFSFPLSFLFGCLLASLLAFSCSLAFSSTSLEQAEGCLRNKNRRCSFLLLTFLPRNSKSWTGIPMLTLSNHWERGARTFTLKPRKQLLLPKLLWGQSSDPLKPTMGLQLHHSTVNQGLGYREHKRSSWNRTRQENPFVCEAVSLQDVPRLMVVTSLASKGPRQFWCGLWQAASEDAPDIEKSYTVSVFPRGPDPSPLSVTQTVTEQLSTSQWHSLPHPKSKQ